MASMYFDVRINDQALQKDITNINRQLGRITQTVKKEGNEIDGLTRRMGTALAGAFSVFAAGSFIKDIARVRGEFQQLEVAFETMLGNKEKADKLMAQVVDFAAKTPFTLQGVAGGAKMLLAYGTAAEDILPTLKALGDVSAGLSVPIERLILNYGQVRTQMKLTGRELRDFQVMGVPLVAELAKQIGVAETKIAEMVSAGQIGFDKVEKAFASMAGQGGKFNDLMDKQSKTITGLASNFKDAWDKMLNSIGESNEGIIAGSIKSAIALTENYETVLKVLGMLVATYGTYKAAVIITNVVDQVQLAMKAKQIVLTSGITVQLQRQTVAQMALNKVTSINPYVAIATIVAGLISLLVVLGKSTKKTEDYVNELNESISSLGSQTNIDKLVSKYNTLQIKTNKTKEEHEELNNTVQELAKMFPEAISAVDAYGKAIAVSGEKIDELNKKFKDNKQKIAIDEIAESQEAVNKKLAEANKLLDEANSGKVKTADRVTGLSAEDKLSESQIKKRREDADKLFVDAEKIQKTIDELQKQFSWELPIEKFKTQHAKLFADISKMTVTAAEETKHELEKLLVYQNSPEITDAIEKQITSLRTQIKSPTVKQQIAQAKKELDEAKLILEGMQKDDSISTDPQRAEQKEIVDNLQKIYDERRNANDKEAAKALEEQKKLKEEQLKADQDYADAKLSLERSLQASIIATQKDGAERQRKEADLQFQLDIDRINAEKDNYLQARNAVKGIKKGDPKYDESLSPEEFEKFDSLEIAARIVKNQKLTEIDRQAAERTKAIHSEVADAFLSDTDREIKAINEKYDALIKRAKEAGEDIADEANKARDVETQSAIIRGKMQILAFEEEIEMQRAEISTQGFDREFQIEKKKLENAKTFAAKRIQLLKDSGKKETDLEIKQQQLIIDQANKNLEDLELETVLNYAQQISSVFGEIGNAIGAMNGELGEAMSTLNNVLTGFMKGGLIGGLISFVGELAKAIASTKGMSTEEMKDNENEAVNKSIERTNKLLEYQLNIMSDLDGADWFSASIKNLVLLNRQLEDSKKKLQGISVYVKGEGRLGAIDTTDWSPEQWLKAINDPKFSFDGLTESAQGYLDQWLKNEQEIKRIQDEQKERLLGFNQEDIAGGLADGIISGLRLAENGLGEFAQSFGKLMETYGRKALEQFINDKYLTDFYQKAFDLANDEEGLTDIDLAALENIYKTAAKGGQAFYDGISKLFSYGDITDVNSQKGMTGAIHNLTEETGGLIVGQFTAMREIGQKHYMTGLEQLDGINRSVGFLEQIANNTKHNAKLNEITELTKETNRILNERL